MNKKLITLREGDDVVFVISKDGKSGKVKFMQEKRGASLEVKVWSTKDWGRYMARRISAMRHGRSIGPKLLEKEK